MNNEPTSQTTGVWRPIDSDTPEGEPILVNAPKSNRGHDSCEVVVICRMPDGAITYWTNGGPNGGSDMYLEEGQPTHWMPLPEQPS